VELAAEGFFGLCRYPGARQRTPIPLAQLRASKQQNIGWILGRILVGKPK